ncbi:type IV secretory system conjugative DNA transfer family protein [Helicobacter pylori]|nr:type IV secretory system conjugative DNA transfer family protein [Helicobacter pylori]
MSYRGAYRYHCFKYDPREPEPPYGTKGALDEIIRTDARSWANTPDDEFGSIMSSFKRFMYVYKDPKVREATSKMSFDYEELRTGNISIYIIINISFYYFRKRELFLSF